MCQIPGSSKGYPEGPGSKVPLPGECPGSPSFYGTELEENLGYLLLYFLFFGGPCCAACGILTSPTRG